MHEPIKVRIINTTGIAVTFLRLDLIVLEIIMRHFCMSFTRVRTGL